MLCVRLRPEGGILMSELTAARELLPEEQCLWSGGPALARIRPGDFGISAYLLAVLVLMAVIAPGFVRRLPVIVAVLVAIVWGGIALQLIGQLIYLLVLRPRIRRAQAYMVTDRRVVVTTGLRGRRTWSAYLNQVDEPVVGSQRDGTADIRLQDRPEPRRRALAAGVVFPVTSQPDIPVLHDIAGAEGVQLIAAQARRRMLARGTGAQPPAAASSSVPVPDGVTLQHAERTLWTGRAGQVPVWFGPEDIYISVFGLVWLAVAAFICALTAVSGYAWTLVFFIPFAIAGGLYPAAGRLVHRRMRIRRSAYVLTDRRLITYWRLREPVVVQDELDALLPPEIRGSMIITRPAQPPSSQRLGGFKNLAWPAASTCPPVLIGIADPVAVRDLICAAQLAAPSRLPASPVKES
jgi:hypothetical protein